MPFSSQEDLWKAVDNLIVSIEKSGHPTPAKTLREGYGALNGLTDGWADFLHSIKKVQAESTLSPEQRKVLKEIHDVAYLAVYRRRPGRWWKFW